ncbi:MAG: lipopolysaccharide assembly LapA domain-containing protein [Stenomitos frigidus ULC029]
MGVLVLILMIVVSIIMVLFGVQNPQPVNVRFFSLESGSISLSLVIVVSALLGASLIGLLSLWDSARRGLRSMRTNKHLLGLEQRNSELEQLKVSLEQENAALKERNYQLENVKQTVEVRAIDSDGTISDR